MRDVFDLRPGDAGYEQATATQNEVALTSSVGVPVVGPVNFGRGTYIAVTGFLVTLENLIIAATAAPGTAGWTDFYRVDLSQLDENDMQQWAGGNPPREKLRARWVGRSVGSDGRKLDCTDFVPMGTHGLAVMSDHFGADNWIELALIPDALKLRPPVAIDDSPNIPANPFYGEHQAAYQLGLVSGHPVSEGVIHLGAGDQAQWGKVIALEMRGRGIQ